ncbi:MAG TPA: lysylphosphatidylglycerol synthase domain-containing protein [Flavitalea sp.]|nr:lysylphosphatidylglycerol synthase domain-containing protein [Flavitalea sp.]
MHSSLNSRAIIQLLIVVCLMLLNWGIEAGKWKVAVKIISPVSFNNSLKAVFAGNTMAFFTPNRTGEYLGRMLYLKKQEMMLSVPLNIICSTAQLIVTCFTGCVGLVFLKAGISAHKSLGAVMPSLNIMLYVAGGVSILLTIFYFRVPFAINWMRRWKWTHKLSTHVRVLDDVNATMLLYILSLSLARYTVFIVQYYLMFSVFGVNINWWQAFWAVSVVFLVIAVIPSVGFLSELAIRWQAGIQLVQLYSSNITGIFATSPAIWIINLVIPALIGGLLILGLKFLYINDEPIRPAL